MSMTGELYRVSSSRLAELLSDPALVEAELYPDDFPANRELNGCSVEKAWNAIEFVLFQLQQDGRYNALSPLTDGNETGCELHYGPVWYRSVDDVKDIAVALATVTPEVFRSAFSVPSMNEQSVYPGAWDEDDPDSEFEYVLAYFLDMLAFYQASAASNSAVLIHLG